MFGPCMCGDVQCPSCGPAQGNFRCPVCGVWADEGCSCTAEQIEAAAKAEAEREAESIEQFNELTSEYPNLRALTDAELVGLLATYVRNPQMIERDQAFIQCAKDELKTRSGKKRLEING